MAYAPVNGLDLYYERHGAGRPLVLLHGGLMTIDLNSADLLGPLSADREVIAIELQGHGHTADTDRPMTIEALADDVIALLDHLEIPEVDVYGFSLGGLVACAIGVAAPDRVGKLIVVSANPHRPPGRESARFGEDLLPTPEDFQAMQDAYNAVAPDPSHFAQSAEKTSVMVHEVAGQTDELRALQMPVLLVTGDRDFYPLADVLELMDLLPNAQLAVLPDSTHVGVTLRSAELLLMIDRFLAA